MKLPMPSSLCQVKQDIAMKNGQSSKAWLIWNSGRTSAPIDCSDNDHYV